MALFDPAIFDPAIFDAGGGGTPTAYTLEVTPASYSLAGNSAGLIARQLVNVTPASYSLTGSSVALVNRQVLAVTPSSYALTGSGAALIARPVLSVTPGSYDLTGASVELAYGAGSAAYLLEITPASYSLAGNDSTLNAQRLAVVTPGAYSVSGGNAGLTAVRTLTVTPSAYSVTGSPVDLTYTPVAGGAYVLDVLPASYALSGESVTLDYSGGTPVGGNGFVIVDTAPRLWWKRKPKALPEEEAEQQVKRVAGVIERIAREQVASPEPATVQREQARQAVAPLVRDMPGFDWSAMYRAAIAALIQQRLEEQARLIAAQEIERIRLFEADEDDVLILLMAA